MMGDGRRGNRKVTGPTAPAPVLLTTEQAAELLTVSPTALRAWRVRGGGPEFIKVGQAVRYDQAELVRWLDEHRVPR